MTFRFENSGKKIKLKKISQNRFNKLLFMRCVHKSLVLSSNFFVGISLNWPSVLGVRLMWIISVCSLYVKLSIRQASTEIMLLCAKSCVIMFGWCILLVSAVSVKRINSAGIKCLLMMCMAAVATIF